MSKNTFSKNRKRLLHLIWKATRKNKMAVTSAYKNLRIEELKENKKTFFEKYITDRNPFALNKNLKDEHLLIYAFAWFNSRNPKWGAFAPTNYDYWKHIYCEIFRFISDVDLEYKRLMKNINKN